jgi:ankyrin repeat protein
MLADMLMSTGADVNMVSLDRGNTALMDAASVGDTDIISDILRRNPALDIRSKNGQSALILALGGKHEEAGALLIAAGCDIGQTDQLGMSAEGYAKLFKLEKILELIEKKRRS